MEVAERIDDRRLRTKHGPDHPVRTQQVMIIERYEIIEEECLINQPLPSAFHFGSLVEQSTNDD